MNINSKLQLKVFIISVLACICLGQNGGMVAITNFDQQNSETTEVLSKKELKSIYGIAKNISHLKGPIIKSKEGDFEYRRSFTSKVEIEVNALQLQNIINEIKKNITQNSFDKSLLLETLDYVESLVHQYVIGKKLVDIGGFPLIISLAKNKDDDISKAAFMVLSAAMQGNREVQSYATNTNLLELLTKVLTSPLSSQTSSSLLTLSAFIRNCPKALTLFIEQGGLQTLSILLDGSYADQKIQMRIVDVIRDIAAEIYDQNPDTFSSVLERIKKNFTRDIELYSICDKIVEIFLRSYDYKTHEKVVSAMSTMFDLCKSKFIQGRVNKELKNLMKLYDPFKKSKMWYKPPVDIELRYYILQDLKELMVKLTSDTTQIEKGIRILKTEL